MTTFDFGPTILSLVLFFVGAAAIALFFAALISIARAPEIDGTQRALWILIVIVAPFLGAIVWFAIGRRR